MNSSADFDYKKYLQMIIKKRYLFVSLALAIMVGVVIASYIIPERYEAKCTVFIEKSVISELVKGIAITPSFEDKLRVLAYTLKSRTLILKVFNDLDLDVNKMNSGQLEKMVKEYQEQTDIKLKNKEGLFTITFNNENPRLAQDFVNTLVRRYIEENTTSKREESYGATNFLAEQITIIKAKLDEVEDRANSYKRDNGSILAHSEGVLLAEIDDAEQKINDIEIKRRQLQSMLSQDRKNDPLKARMSVLQRKQQELELVYTDNHPGVIEINNEIAVVKQQLQSGSAKSEFVDGPSLEMERISMELNSLRDVQNNQRRIIASKRSLLRSIPEARTGLDELERERNSQKLLYEQLVARYGQSEVSKQMEVHDKATTFRIVDPAILPTKPYSPQRLNIILLGIAGGLVTSFGLLMLLDYLDNSVRNVESLKSLGVQILAVVPIIENPAELQALRKRDYWFYGVAAVCFMLVLATVPLELMRALSFDVYNPGEIKLHLKNLTVK